MMHRPISASENRKLASDRLQNALSSRLKEGSVSSIASTASMNEWRNLEAGRVLRMTGCGSPRE